MERMEGIREEDFFHFKTSGELLNSHIDRVIIYLLMVCIFRNELYIIMTEQEESI